MNTGTPGFGLVLVGLLAIVSFDLVLVLLMVSGKSAGIRGSGGWIRVHYEKHVNLCKRYTCFPVLCA